MMKRRTILCLTAMIAAMSCSLTEDRNSYESGETFYKTPIQCRAAVNGCYPPVHSIYSPVGFFFSVEAVSDIFWSDYQQADAQLDISPSYSGAASTVWNNCYAGIMRCNEVIWCIENICELDAEDKMPYAAEARVMRALYYYILTNHFGDVPYYTFRVNTKEDIAAVRAIPRIDAREIRHNMYNDLNDNALPWFTTDNGLKARTCDVQGHRAGYALALLLMGKFAMWNEDWNGALAPLGELEKLYGELTEKNYPMEQNLLWRYKNTPESIFEIQNDYEEAGTKYYGKVAYVAQPASSGNGWYNGVFMPELGTTVIHGEGIQCNPYYASFRPARGNKQEENADDPIWKNGLFNPIPLTYNAYDASLGRYSVKADSVTIARLLNGESTTLRGYKVDRRTVYKLGMAKLDGAYKNGANTFTYVKNNGLPWGGPEFWRLGQVSNNDGNNYKIFRYADAVLMMAECHARLGEMAAAQKYLNYTRARALVDPLPYSSGDDLLSNIMDERARELGGEFHRKWDLVRWGIWYERTKQYNQRKELREGGNIRPYHRYYPIPDTECALTGYLLNNEEYAK